MSQDEERQRKSRVVVETPNARREEYYTQTRRVPDRQGYSTGVVATVALAAVAITALVVFLFMNMGSDRTDATNVNISAATVPTPIPTVPTPFPTMATPLPAMTQPSTIIVPAPVVTEAAPVVVPTTAAPATPAPPTDADFESRINKAFLDDAQLGSLGVTVTVANGRATLTGTVESEALKNRAARVASTVRGLRGVDNKIIVETPPEED
ncbi:MAG TPA: BON domain-containing protein [Pyrinomonadaceae bacterium]|nr:BON domain-containing protein [Pyrinomonadaceae bacterium]